MGLVGCDIGVAIKVADGQERGYLPVIVDLLHKLGMFGEGADVPEALARFWCVPIMNTQKREVGEVTSAVSWPGDWPADWPG